MHAARCLALVREWSTPERGAGPSSWCKIQSPVLDTRCVPMMAASVTKANHPGGRPTLYRRELGDQLVDAMAKGLSAEAAAKISVSTRSLLYWQQQHPALLQAIKEGRQRLQLWREECALAMANCASGNTRRL
jgi:hypothetical protein